MATLTQEKYDAIPWEEVESSNIARVAWEGDDPQEHDLGELVVEFHGGRAYVYNDVPQKLAEELRDAESVGRHFAENVRGQFPGDRIEIEDAEQ